VITSLSRSDADINEEITAVGTDLNDIDRVSFLGFNCELVSSSSTSCVFKMPSDVYQSGIGPIEIITKAGKVVSSTSVEATGDNFLGLF
jgi:hypothetical protein